MKVLLVEDDAFVAAVLHAQVDFLGHECITDETGSEN